MKILEIIKKRRSVTRFSIRTVEKEKIDRVVQAASYDPPEGQKAPIKIVVISGVEIKQKIRQTAEQIEKAYIQGAGNGNGDRELQLQLGETGWRKPFLEEAPYLIVACSLVGQPYQAASTWLALGRILLAASDEGLGSLCYTPPMPAFLRKVISIPSKYMPIAIIPVGYSAEELFPTIADEDERKFRNLFSGRFNWQKP